jgi:hypothetical protein
MEFGFGVFDLGHVLSDVLSHDVESAIPFIGTA